MFVQVLFLAYFVGLGLLVAWLARSRGRDPLAWFVLGAVFNIVAVVVVAALPPVERDRRRSAFDDGGSGSA
jgi:hypothetical protein